MTTRLISSGSGRGPSTLLGGRNGAGGNAPGGLVDVADNDHNLHIYTANGYSKLGPVGTTAQRPTSAAAGTPYIDTTLSKTVWFDGVSWRDPITAAVV